MRVVVALGGNALLRRHEPMTAENQAASVALACEHLARVDRTHDLVVSHGNGPQIGLLALEGEAYTAVPPYPLDVLGAETQGEIGYLVERELRSRLPADWPVASVLTMVEVDPRDPAFSVPTKPIGPIYEQRQAAELAAERNWTFRPDGDAVRRVVASPAPQRIVERDAIAKLLDGGCTVICAGGGGIPVTRDERGRLVGVEGVIDKDLASSLLACDIGADVLVMATDIPAVYLGFGSVGQSAIRSAHPDALLPGLEREFPVGSMLPKVTAACEFARATGHRAVIGQLSDIEALVAGTTGTSVSTAVTGVVTVGPEPVTSSTGARRSRS